MQVAMFVKNKLMPVYEGGTDRGITLPLLELREEAKRE